MRRQATTKITPEYLLSVGVLAPGQKRKRGAQVDPVLPRLYAGIDYLPNGCWQWNGMRMKNDYGTISIEGLLELVHRVSYMVHKGAITEPLHVCHSCDANYAPGDTSYRLCINPAHLFLGTNAQNHADSVTKGRQARGERIHAPKGVDQHSAKLTEDDVREVRRLYATKEMNQPQIAARYGTSAMAISKIVTGKTWKHVP